MSYGAHGASKALDVLGEKIHELETSLFLERGRCERLEEEVKRLEAEVKRLREIGG